MTLAELISQFRTDSDDVQAGALSLDGDVKLWLNEAVEEAAIRANLIHEADNTAVCEISIDAGTSTYPLHDAVIDITRADFTPTGSTESINLTLTDRVEQDRTRSDWRTTTDVPRELIQLDTSVRMGCIPSVAGLLKIECHRLPLASMAEDDDTPEIGRVHHRHLVHWALHRCYMRPDAEVHDPGRAAVALSEFERYFGLRPDADLRRSFQANVPMHNKAVW